MENIEQLTTILLFMAGLLAFVIGLGLLVVAVLFVLDVTQTTNSPNPFPESRCRSRNRRRVSISGVSLVRTYEPAGRTRSTGRECHGRCRLCARDIQS